MASLPVILAGISLAIWTGLTFFRAAFWQVRASDGDAVGQEPLSRWPRVVAVVPARNEAETIERCVESLVRQDYAGELQLMVVDDHSEDGTGALASIAAQSAGKVARATILQAEDVQAGWTGKLWALHRGISNAAPSQPEYYWFTDADIVHSPDTLRRLVAKAESQRLDLASLMVLLQAKTIPEKLLIPAFLYFFLMLYPPKWIADRNVRTAGAGRMHFVATRDSGTYWRNFSHSRGSDRRLRSGRCSETKRRIDLDGAYREQCQPQVLHHIRGDTRFDRADGVHAVAVLVVAFGGHNRGNAADLCGARDLFLSHPAPHLANESRGVGADDADVSADGSFLPPFTAVGAVVAARRDFLLLCDLLFCRALPDGPWRTVERSRAGTGQVLGLPWMAPRITNIGGR